MDTVDHGPSFLKVDVPEKVFEKTFDQEALDAARKHAPKYKELVGRFDPFEYEKMRSSAGTWSVLIDRLVVTFGDACAHALGVCELWVKEDKELAEIAENKERTKVEKEAKSKAEVFLEGSKAFQVEEARLAWREAVRQRNEIVGQWDEYVKQMRIRYRTLRDS